ncbi:MAG: transglycosylase domain-containing protein [Alphaproteobacteria bacterium]|nr:transglycosylase domain-containing protein [Alphaproteobacteria bacterium]
MTIVDSVRGRLSRFNPALDPPVRRGRPVYIPIVRAIRIVRWAMFGFGLILLAAIVVYESRTSTLESWLFDRWDHKIGFDVQAGASPSVRFPTGGPYDERVGYTAVPQFIAALTAHRYAIDGQARWSPGLERFVEMGGFPVFPEKDQAGLKIYDRTGDQIYSAQYPGRAYRSFAAVPPLVSNSLMFIEDRYLLDPREARRNPAIEWNRFALAAVGRVGGIFLPQLRQGGGSTLATQIEKFRHSPRGLTGGIGEKFRQMLTASARSYIDGPDTMQRRRAILTAYLDSTPLASMPGYGEVIGIPEALWIWFGTDYVDANTVLNSEAKTAAEWANKGLIYRQVLSLLLSERRPSYYLVTNRDALTGLTDKYLRALSEAGVIDNPLRDAALGATLTFHDQPPPLAATSYVKQKATQDIREKLVALLKLPDFYSLDRVDLSVNASLDTTAQEQVTSVLQRLSDPLFLKSAGMIGPQLLGDGDPAKVTYSLVLYERGNDRNLLRIHADSLNKPFDINSDGKLMLGSTAKLRTMVTYLDILTDLHTRLAPLPVRELNRIAASAQDPLTQWAAAYLARTPDRTPDRTLQPLLDAAMQRHYSAEPGSFFTGGGTQSFGNFDSDEDIQNPTVEQAFDHSINLSFVRLLHDIVTYYTVASGVQVNQLLDNPDDPQRLGYLQRFADRDSRHFLGRFYKDYHGLSTDDALALLTRRTRPSASHLAAIYMSVRPDARLAELQQFLVAHLPRYDLSSERLWDLFLSYSPAHMSLNDRAYVSGIHPLELWLAKYLEDNPDANWNQVLGASAEVRQQSYAWLFKGGLQKQDSRIRILLEQDAFNQILENWRSAGYPFSRLVPSLGTAIGASGDRPDALADLMGTIMNDGVRLPNVTIEHLHFAANTPYQTDMSPVSGATRVMPVEVARTLQHLLPGVVEQGTASRLRDSFVAPDGAPLAVGGKTGTGDNRYDRFGTDGSMISSRAVDRTATFVFFIGDRFFGTVTAYVPGEDADSFHFSSALAVQLLKVLQPQLAPLINGRQSMEALVGSSMPN